MEIKKVFYIMLVHFDLSVRKPRKLVVFYDRGKLEPIRVYHQNPRSRTPTEYKMLDLFTVSKKQFNESLDYYERMGILQDYGAAIPAGIK